MNTGFRDITIDVLEPVFTIGIIAKKIGISPETLRLYERKGLLITHRTKTGRRLYSQKDLEWIVCIRRQIKEHHMNLAAIMRLLALIPCWEIKPCGIKERETCPAYKSNNQACWNLDIKRKLCDREDCRICPVYLKSVKVGHLKEIYQRSMKPSS